MTQQFHFFLYIKQKYKHLGMTCLGKVLCLQQFQEETVQMTISSNIDKQIVVYSLNRILQMRGSANYNPWTKSGPLPIFANAFYWNTAKLILLYNGNGSFHAMTQLSCCSKDHLVCKTRNFYYLLFTERVCQPLVQVNENKLTIATFVNMYESYK